MLRKKTNGVANGSRLSSALQDLKDQAVDRRTFLKRSGLTVGGVAAATINLAAGYLITKVDDDNYTFATATTSSITESGGGGFASAGPVTVTA